MGSNVISGLAGAVNEALFQVTIADLFFTHQRASANGIYLAVVCVGNYLGPVAAGYVAVSQGWRWAYYYSAIFMGVTTIVMLFALEESKYNPPVIRGQPVKPVVCGAGLDHSQDPHEGGPKCLKIHEDSSLSTTATRTSVADNNPHTRYTYWQRHSLYRLDLEQAGTYKNNLFRHVYQPFEILFWFPAVAFAAL